MFQEAKSPRYLGTNYFDLFPTKTGSPVYNDMGQMRCPTSEWPSGLYSFRQVAEVKLGRVRPNFGWVTSEA